MFLLIAIAFLLKRYGTQAVPLPAPTTTSSTFESPIFARGDLSDGCHRRTILNILWSCLSTTFACTWVSVHPNVPFNGEGKWTLVLRRIFLMLFSILAPEFMILWAFKQWRGARKIKNAVNEAWNKHSPDTTDPWTTVHGHFLQMGGFRLLTTAREKIHYKDPGLPEITIPRVFMIGPRKGEIITGLIFQDLYQKQSDAKKRSGETSGKDLQEGPDTIHQGVLTYDAFVILLSKNLIRFPTITKDEINDKSKGDGLSKGFALLQLTWFIIQIISRAAQGLAITELELTTAALVGLNSAMYLFWWSKPLDVHFPVEIRTEGVEKLLADRPKGTNAWSFSDQKIITLESTLWSINPEVNFDASQKTPSAEMSRKQIREGLAFLFSPLSFVINFGLLMPIAQALCSNARQGTLLPMTRKLDIDKHVYTFSTVFYSENAEVIPLLGTASIAGALFGGVHGLAWHFSFPSHSEQMMWRAASLELVGACALSFVGSFLWDYIDGLDGKYLSKIRSYSLYLAQLILLLLTIVIYPVSRLLLLVLAITSLLSLPPSAFSTVQWVELVPHI